MRPRQRGAAAAAVALLLSAAAGTAAQAPALAAYRDSIPGTLVTFEMVPVPSGRVTVDGRTVAVRRFWIGRTEVTWDAYDVFAFGLDTAAAPPPPLGADATARPSRPYGAPDHGFGHQGYPAISMTRTAAEAFGAWLSARTGKRYRLPTEAEWQRAADIAATSAPDAGWVDTLAWHTGNAGGKTHPVATRARDALGLHDLFGNAAEWVSTAHGTLVVRGGSYRDPAVRVGPRGRAVQEYTWNETDPQFPKSRWWLSDGPFVGFRLVREL